MKTYRITVLAGDGIGPEVVRAAVEVLHAISTVFPLRFDWNDALIGGAAIDAEGKPLPESTIKSCLASDAVLLGAVGHPRFDGRRIRPEQGLLELRKQLGLFANIRPVQTRPSLFHSSPLKNDRLVNVDLVVLRELTGGLYYGNSELTDESAFDTCVYTRSEIERMASLAFRMAMERRKKLTLVDKANVLKTSQLWRKTVAEMAHDFPEVKTEFMYVDNAAMQIIRNPAAFDVILTENMFGDILSDVASVLPGTMGLLPSASTGLGTAVFEPVHGSYPEAENKDLANPVAAILSAAMMLAYLGEKNAADAVTEAVNWSIETGIVTKDIDPENGLACSQVSSAIAAFIRGENNSASQKKFRKENAILP